jgi:methylglyoxal reductase
LSVVGMGCWSIGGEHWGDDWDDATSIRAVHAALDVGINWFDTAPLYGHGHSDEVLVRALAAADKQALIATKVGVVDPGESGHAESWLTPERMRQDLEASLLRLGRDHIDWLQVHWPCQHGTPLAETFGALDAFVKEGKVRHLGVCNYNGPTLARIMDLVSINSIQTPYSLLRREFENDVRPVVSKQGLGCIAYETLCRGLLTGKYDRLPSFPDTDMRRFDDRFQGGRFHHARGLVRDLTKVAAKLNVPTSAVSVAWVLSQPSVTHAVVGAKTPEQIQANAQAARLLGKPTIQSVVRRIAEQHGPS